MDNDSNGKPQQLSNVFVLSLSFLADSAVYFCLMKHLYLVILTLASSN